MAGATYRSGASVTNGTAGTSVTVSKPAGTTSGDLLVAVINEVGVASITAPSGWTLVDSASAGTSVKSAVYYKVAGGSEPASYTWTLGASVRRWGWIGAYTGWDTTAASPVVTHATTSTTSTTNWAAYAGDVQVEEARYLAVIAGTRGASGSTTTWTGSATERLDTATNAGVGSGTDIAGAVYELAALPSPPPAALTAYAVATSTQIQAASVIWVIALKSAFASPTYPLDIVLEAAFGEDPDSDPAGWTWTDISTYLRDPGVTLTVGRRNEQPGLEPCTLSFALNNSDGRFTPGSPSGAYWPNVVRNVPVRVSLDGIGVAPPYERVAAFVGSWTPRWDTSLNLATVAVQASGRLRRAARRTTPLRSPLYRIITADGPVAYWPLEDLAGAQQSAPAVGDTPLTWTGTTPTLGSSGPDGSAGALTSGSATVLTAPLTGSSSTAWSVEVALRVPSAPSGATRALSWVVNSGTYSQWAVLLTPSGGTDTLTLQFLNSAGSVAASSAMNWLINSTEPYATDLMLVVSARQSGGNVEWEMQLNSADGGVGTSGSFAGTLGTLGGISAPSGYDRTSWQYSHLSAWDKVLDSPWGSFGFNHWTALDGHTDELSVSRFQRVCDEAGISYEVIDPLGDITGEAMGPQPTDGLAAVLAEITALDAGGTIHDGGQSGALVYVPRAARYNREPDMTLDMDAGQVAPPLAPTYDDQGLRTAVTATRSGGSSATRSAVSADGVYEERRQVNAASDGQLRDIAAWLVHTGTVDELRYPQLSIDLRRNPDLAQEWVYCRPGQARVTVDNLPVQHPPGGVDVYLEGYTETIGAYRWAVDLNCSPARPYRVFQVEDTEYGRIDTGGSNVAGDITSTQTSITVATTIGPIWVTTAARPTAFPFDIEIDGEQLTVTNLVGTSNPQAFTVIRSVNGISKAHVSGTAVRLWRAPVIAL